MSYRGFTFQLMDPLFSLAGFHVYYYDGVFDGTTLSCTTAITHANENQTLAEAGRFSFVVNANGVQREHLQLFSYTKSFAKSEHALYTHQWTAFCQKVLPAFRKQLCEVVQRLHALSSLPSTFTVRSLSGDEVNETDRYHTTYTPQARAYFITLEEYPEIVFRLILGQQVEECCVLIRSPQPVFLYRVAIPTQWQETLLAFIVPYIKEKSAHRLFHLYD